MSVVNFGVDNGHNIHKIFAETGEKTIVVSTGRPGSNSQINFMGERDIFEYSTSEGDYEVGNVDKPSPTDTDHYPVSALARVLMIHGLIKSMTIHENTRGSEVNICVGLPIKRFYRADGTENTPLIEQVKDNFLKNDVVPKIDPGFPVPKIRKVDVYPENLSAVIGMNTERGPDGKLQIRKDNLEKSITVIDVGGRTLDGAFFRGFNMDNHRTFTEEFGMKNLESAVKRSVCKEYNLNDLTHEQMQNCVHKKTLRVRGKDIDIAELVNRCILDFANELRMIVGKYVKDSGRDSDVVHFIGGTIAFLRKNGVFDPKWYEHQEISIDPTWDNAEGMKDLAVILSQPADLE